ncbi:MAG: GNAT family N-acetyltransferase [Anaerolineae bacterium]|nr:GNAT family N-acetyltransferase [Anaerolineae bacterium]
MPYTFRQITFDDLAAFYDLYRAEHIETYGSFAMSRDEVRAEWEAVGFDLEKMTQAAFTAEGEMAGFVELRYFRRPPVRSYLYGYVRPEHRNQGIGTQLLQWGLENSSMLFPLVPVDARVVLQAFGNKAADYQLLEDQGFNRTRQTLIMQIELDQPMPPVAFPQGFQLLTLADHPVLADFVRVIETCFEDHRGHVTEPLQSVVERWEKWIADSDSYAPELFMLLREGDQDVGALLAWDQSDEDAEKAWVASLGIMPAYRRRGFASLLLRHAFYVFQQRGKKRLGLNVDGSSLTGAHLLYQGVGMHVVQVYNAYEKEIRAGVELTRQA